MPDKDELLMWRILGKLESLAVNQYESWFPHLATPEKKELVSQLLKAAPVLSAERWVGSLELILNWCASSSASLGVWPAT